MTSITTAFLLVLAPVQDEPSQEREQETRIEALEKRVAELEARQEEPGEAEELPTTLRVYWDEGLRMATADGNFKLRLGGRTAFDMAWIDEDPEVRRAVGHQEDGVEFRRAYLYASGLIYDWVEYKAEYAFDEGEAGFEDLYVGFTKLPCLGKLRIGHMDEPFGMELRTSNRHTTFMERGLTHALTPGTETGVLAKNLVLNDRLFWAAGIFRDGDRQGRDLDDGAYNVTGRVVALPVYADEGRKLMHVGIGGSHRNHDDFVRFRIRPEAHLSQFRYVDTGDIFVEDENILGLEFAWVHGPFSIQSEYIVDRLYTGTGGYRKISAWYAFVSFFLTGESRNYELPSGTFDRPRPLKNFQWEEDGWGAFEFAARLSQIDLNDDTLRGGRQRDITLGLNWYFNPNAKVMFNYVHAEIDRDTYDGGVDILQMRVQVDF